MSIREIIYAIFYSLCFLLAIYLAKFGLTDSHTPPAPFFIEAFALPIGLVLFLIDAMMRKSTKVHKIGLAANGLIIALMLILY
jgi:hypothetical protein